MLYPIQRKINIDMEYIYIYIYHFLKYFEERESIFDKIQFKIYLFFYFYL